MATMCGPDAQGSSTSQFIASMDPLDPSVPRVDASQHTEPPQNPPFSFPARMDSPSSAPSSYSRSTGRPLTSAEPQDDNFRLSIEDTGRESGNRRPRPAALPAFNFNPGADLPSVMDSPNLLSPPKSPGSPQTGASQQRPGGHGHRRGGSEFVGGSIRQGNSISVLGTSPTKSENGFGSFQPPPKRGHRRGMSSAISTTDLPLLPAPINPVPIGGSAPTSPTNFGDSFISSIPTIDPAALSSFIMPRSSPVVGSTQSDTTPPPESPKQRQGTRARVGFSDTLEYIPRPISMVSSDTSSIATARPSHSVSGSISSIVSAVTPPGRESPILERSPTRDMADPRPSTAGAILENTQNLRSAGGPNVSPRRRNSIPALMEAAESDKLAPASTSPTKSKRWSFFGFDSLTSSGSPTKSRACSVSSTDSVPRAVSAGSSSDHGSDSMAEATSTKKSGRKGKKKRRVKGWGSLLHKSHRKDAKNSTVRPPTPPPSVLPPEEEDEDADLIETPSELGPPTPTVMITESPKTEEPPPRRAAEDSSYMIDLDAALGPFNTPLPPNPEWEAAQQAAGNLKRRLHSDKSSIYHRRTESAPTMPKFDGRGPLTRFGSSSTMADVFEDDEEEAEAETQPKSVSGSLSNQGDEDSDGDTTPPAGPQRRQSLPDIQDVRPLVRRRSSGLSDKDQAGAQSVRTERSMTSLKEDVIVEEPVPPMPQSSGMAQRGSESTAPSTTARLGSVTAPLAPDAQPIYVTAPPNPTSPYAISHASSYPSPRSPASVDAQRISTAPSSVADGNSFHSLLMGEPGPEVRLSVDNDIPSLTSSTSTMTRESMFVPGARHSQPTLREYRPMSVSSAAFGRRRSSLVSLSRLISSSHGERSKLSMEVTLDNDMDKRRSKNSKTKRLGRMMQFWKPNKEDSQAE